MISCRAVYLLYFAAFAAFMPYLPVYFKEIALSGAQIGLLTALPRIVALVCAPAWGAIADKVQRHRDVLLASLLGTTIAVAGIVQTARFAPLVVALLAFAFFSAPNVSLVDHITLETLGERRGDYGKVRAWGTIGWGLASPLAGWLSERGGLMGAFSAFFVFQAGTVAAAWFLPRAASPVPFRLLRGLRTIFRDRRWFVFLLAVFVAGMGVSVVHFYLFLYLQELGFAKGFWGLTMVFSTGAELPVMWLGGRLLRRWSSHHLLLLSLLALVVRSLAYSWTSSGPLILLIQLLHGPMFGFLWIGGVARAHELAPPGMGATAQGLFSGVAMGVGTAAGAFLGGIVLDAVGAPLLYRWTGIGATLGFLLLALAGRATRQPKVQ
ncbi:MAG: major facilitator superfamily domain-containing protein 6 [Planctomycetota bacterium]